MEFSRRGAGFERLGYRQAALAVDPPARARKLRADLELRFPLLCDPERATVREWGLYNRWERGGIAVPATVVLSSAGLITFLRRESMTRRWRAEDVLRLLAPPAGPAPRRRAVLPRWREWWRALRG